MASYTLMRQDLLDTFYPNLAWCSGIQNSETLEDIKALLGNEDVTAAQFYTDTGDYAPLFVGFSYPSYAANMVMYQVIDYSPKGNRVKHVSKHFYSLQFSPNGGYLPSSTEYYEDYNSLRSRIKEIKEQFLMDTEYLGDKNMITDYRNHSVTGTIALGSNEHITIEKHYGIIPEDYEGDY